MKTFACLAAAILFSAMLRGEDFRGLVQNSQAGNEALVVSALRGLPGGKSNIQNMGEILSNPNYQFHSTVLSESTATKAQILDGLTAAAKRVAGDGTLLFYFSGHGGNQIVEAQDRLVKTTEIKKAIEDGRQQAGALARLVLIFDACHSGSHSGPFQRSRSLTAESLAEAMRGGERTSPYWNQLIVMTSSQAHELSWVTAQGHLFTVALHKAFPKSIELNETIGEFFARTKQNLTASHPTYKVLPEDLMNEKMAP
jgi:uncharacterized caspase-like protein